jgi:AraC-like DNA-binding protein
LRLEYARSLLLGRRASITQIALDCGFADGAHFSREFGARFGVTPRRYVQTHAGAAPDAGAAG